MYTEFLALSGTATTAGAYLTAQAYGYGVRYWRTEGTDARRAHRDAARIRRTWPRLARYLGLALRDDLPTTADMLAGRQRAQDTRRWRAPRIRRVDTDEFGVTVEFATVPGVGLEEFRRRADHLADHWRAARVAITQPRSGRIVVRAVHRDPLALALTAATPRGPIDLTAFPIGLDEHGQVPALRFRNASGYGVYGIPGSGKTSFLLGLIAHYAEHPAVQFVVLDGKVSTGLDGDYQDVADRCAAVIGDDLAQANRLLRELVGLRRFRSSTIRATLGTANVWDVGPSASWPLLLVIVDECHTYVQQVRDGGRKDLKERNSHAAENALLLEDLAKKGRSVGLLLIPATQKGTGDAIPTQIRDVLTGAVCFATRTDAAAVAALGEDIRQHPEADPTSYVGEAFVGVATIAAEGRAGFTRVRTPYCTPMAAAAAAQRGAHLTARRDVLPGLTEGQAHRALPPSDLEQLETPRRADPGDRTRPE